MWLRLAFHSWLSSELQGILALAHNEREAKWKCITTFQVAVENEVARSKDANLSIPEWAVDVIFEQFHVEKKGN